MFSLLFTAFLFAKLVNGFILVVVFDISNIVSPGVNSIFSLIVSRFSSGYLSSVVLFVVCTLRIYHISPCGILFVIIFIVSLSIPLVPMSAGGRGKRHSKPPNRRLDSASEESSSV